MSWAGQIILFLLDFWSDLRPAYFTFSGQNRYTFVFFLFNCNRNIFPWNIFRIFFFWLATQFNAWNEQPKLDSDMHKKLVPHRLFIHFSIYAKMHQYSILVLDTFIFPALCWPLVHQTNAHDQGKKRIHCKNVTAP